MSRLRQSLVVTSVLVAFAMAPGSVAPADAAVITFTATDLTDVNAGEDLWRYEYLLSEISFDVDQGFSVYFDLSLYANLQDPPPSVGAAWDILVIQPDTFLSSDGFYDALALVSSASLTQPFVLTFAWLGGAGSAPGLQPFTINEFDSDGNISFVESGTTRPSTAVPEPGTLLLLLSGVGVIGCRRSSRCWSTTRH
jgi:PEP-CTERM motif